MGMTPQEIQEKHFHDTFRGYSHEEVDLFLDEVAVAFERLYRENQSFMRRVVDLEEQLKRAQEVAGTQPARAQEVYEEDPGVTESTLKRMLLIAQETADRAVQEARQRAREIQEQARARADEMMEHAERRVRELSSQRMEKEKELERAKEALRRFDQQYRASFRVFIESQLEALKDLPATPPGTDMEAGPDAAGVFETGGSPLGYEQSPPLQPAGMETVAMSMGLIEQGSSQEESEQSLAGSADESYAGDENSGLLHGVPDVPASAGWEEGETQGGPESVNDPELVRTPRAGEQPASEVEGPVGEEEEDPRRGRSIRKGRRERKQGQGAEPADSPDAEEDRLIRELFWGEED